MADTDHTTNVTPLRPADPTNAERQRRHRAKQRKRRPTATPKPTASVTSPLTPTVTVGRHGSVTVRIATLCAALALATCSAAFSISGLTSIFAGAFLPVIGMGCAFEVGKLSAVAWLGQRHWSPRGLRLALAALVAVLMVLNSIGVYGFLSRAHIEHALAGDLQVSNASAVLDARLDAKQADLDDIKARITQLDQTKTVTAVKRGVRTTTVGDQGPAREKLVHEREAAENALADLRIEKAKVDGERKAVEADLGPVRYLATLLGSTDEQTMRGFILVVALLLDPAAVLLLLAATHRVQQREAAELRLTGRAEGRCSAYRFQPGRAGC